MRRLLVEPIRAALVAGVASRFALLYPEVALDTPASILPRPERAGAALSIVVQAATFDTLDAGGETPAGIPRQATAMRLVATCAVAGADAFGRLDALQAAVRAIADEPPEIRDEGGTLIGRLFATRVVGMEWGEAEQGDISLCEVRLDAGYLQS